MGASVEAEVDNTKAAAVMEMVADGIAMILMVGNGAVPELHTMDRSSSLPSHTMRQ